MRQRIWLRLVKILNIILITIPFEACWIGYYAERIYSPYFQKGNYVIVILYMILYMVYERVYGALEVSTNRISEVVYSQSLAAIISDAIMYVVILLLTRKVPVIWPMLVVVFMQIFLATGWSLIVHKWYFDLFPAKRTVIVYDEREGVEELMSEYGLEKKFDIVASLKIDICIENNMQHLKDVEAVFLCGIHSHERNMILKYCIKNNIIVYVMPRIGDVIMSGAKQMHMLHMPLLRVCRYKPSFEYKVVKRILDVLVCTVALLVLFPIFFVTAIAIKFTDGGPVFYKQCRLTKDGKHFNVLKFRSMRVDAEKDGVARLSTGDKDDRITPIGKFIRKVRIDELPQLINIIKGDMSIVGPRPERPEIAAKYEEVLPEFSLRLQAKAGLTGYAQVYGKYNTTPYDKLQMDLMYIARPSFVEDMRIIFATIKILFMPESTDGVDEGKTTALENNV